MLITYEYLRNMPDTVGNYQPLNKTQNTLFGTP